MNQSEQSEYQRILVAVDFSQYSIGVVSKAKALAEKYQAELELIHVVEIPVYPVLEDVAVLGLPGLWNEEVAQQLQLASSTSLEKLAADSGVEKYRVIVGLAGKDIVDYAHENNVDLIVVGSHGMSGIKRLIGSTTNTVINHAECDVLSVRFKE